MRADRLRSLLAALTLVVPVLGAWAASAQDLSPAEFRTAAAGARLTFDDFGCTVVESTGFSLDCVTVPTADTGKMRLSFVGYAAVEGKIARIGFMRTLITGDIDFKSITLPAESHAALQQLWPLAVGNFAAFKMEATLTHGHTGYQGTRRTVHPVLRATANVMGTETVQLSEGAFLTYVIQTDVPEFHIPGYTRAGLRWTFWYAPNLGLVVKIRTEWTQGPAARQWSESELWRADIPAS